MPRELPATHMVAVILGQWQWPLGSEELEESPPSSHGETTCYDHYTSQILNSFLTMNMKYGHLRCFSKSQKLQRR